MQTLLNGVTTTTTSATKTINGLHTIVCKGLKSYKQFINFYISVDNVHFVLYKSVTLGNEVFNVYVGNCHIYCKFETELENNDPIYVNMT
jgi:hypothetical protein